MLALLVILVVLNISSANTAKHDQAVINQLINQFDNNIKPPNEVGIAQQAAVEFLDAKNATVPLAQGVPPDLGRVYADASKGISVHGKAIPYYGLVLYKTEYYNSPGQSNYRLVDQFLVGVGGATYELSVPIIDDNNNPSIANFLTFAPFNPPASGSQLNWSNYSQITLTSGETQQIQQWVTAYLTDDTTQLYELTGDTSSNHVYGGLTGWALVGSPSIVSASQNNNNQVLVQVDVPMAPSSDQKNVTVGAYDILLGNVNVPIPYVVAWGPAGVGWHLKPYQNATPGTVVPTTQPNSSGS